MKIVIIGGGQAAASTVQKFRTLDTNSDVTIICEESHPPYQRPPLSKKYLAGEMELERLFFKPLAWYEENNVDLKLNTKVVFVDRTAKTVTLQNGDTLPYDKLVFATGSRPKTLPESVTKGAKNIYAVRTLKDIDDILPEFQEGRELLVIGGGYIGLEAAAIARKFKLNVAIVEAAPRILGRVASELTAEFIKAMHLKNEVEILEGVAISEFDVQNGRVIGAKMEDGTKRKVDFMIVGIGIIPNSEVAQAAGVICEDGILVDEFCRTNDASIFAAGDCTRFVHEGARIRIESVGNAIDQGNIVGANLAGQNMRYEPKPWFWSDQYETTLQIAGLNHNFDEVVLRGDQESQSVSIWYYKNDTLISVDAINDPRAYMIAKRVIEGGKSIPKEAAANPETDLKTYMK